MNEVDRDGPFSYRRSHTLDVPGPDVAHREDAGQARLQHLRRSRQMPPKGRITPQSGFQVAARENEALVIESKAVLQPLGPRGRTRHNEYVANIVTGCFASLFVEPLHAFQMRLAL